MKFNTETSALHFLNYGQRRIFSTRDATPNVKLALKGIELIAPHKSNRVKSATQDGNLEDIKKDGKLNDFSIGSINSKG